MKLMQIAQGILTYLPGMKDFRAKGTGGTDSGRYCYSVWLRHLVMANNAKLNTDPKVIAELGPGDSLGTGLAALISGAEKYYAFDVVKHSNTVRNLNVFEEIVSLFKAKEDIPGADEFPKLKPFLQSYDFPSHFLSEERLKLALADERIEKIRSALLNIDRKKSIIDYKVPWFDSKMINEESVDMIFSQAVLEHVDDLSNTYQAMHRWLKKNGYISHEIDFKCHGMACEWNGHWIYSDFVWKIIRGKRPFLLNREPHSTHLNLLSREGFAVLCDKKIKSESCINRDKLPHRFKDISDDDLTTSAAFIQASKL